MRASFQPFLANLLRSRARFGARFVATSLVLGGLLLAASCGSRTGLFVPDPFDGGDARIDAPVDAPPDALDGAVPCVPGKFALERATAQLMFVLDRSGSMRLRLDGEDPEPGEPRRWDILQSALLATILPFDNEIAMGAKFFPQPLAVFEDRDPVLACATEQGVGIAPAIGNAGAIINVFGETEPRGGTPTAEAVSRAAEHLVQRRAVARTIVLATDGAPNCNDALPTSTCTCTLPPDQCDDDISSSNCLDDTRTIQTIKTISDTQKVPIYVIGIGRDRPEFVRVLDDMAVAGGRPLPTTPRHYSVQTPADLTNALTTIRDGVARCTYLTPSAPTDPNAITIEIGGAKVPRDPTHGEGWDWVDQAYGSIAFFGTACDKLLADEAASGVVTCGP